MRVDREVVAQIAALAKIDLTADELDHYTVEISAILDYVDQLHQVAIPPEYRQESTASKPAGELRDDVPLPSLERSETERNAPEFVDGFFVVPRILGGQK